MQIDILTLFPRMFESPFNESIVKRSIEEAKLILKIHNLRDWSTDSYKTVDDRPYGGGAGMILKVDVIDRALEAVELKNKHIRVKKLLMSAKGKSYTQQMASEFSHHDQLIIVAGHYEGVDERVSKYLVDEEIRIGNFVLTGGELPAMVLVDSIARLIPGVLGNEHSAVYESHSNPGYLEHPQYTRPSDYKGWKVPEVLLSGNHSQIEKWKVEESTSESA